MNYPQPGDYIDIHMHGGKSSAGIFILDTIMAHESRMPDNNEGKAYTCGIHPWFLTEENKRQQTVRVRLMSELDEVAAIGEAGFDKLRGPAYDLQRKVFRDQVEISENLHKPLVVHCVKSWEVLLEEHKELNPRMPWLIHGFRGKIELARQLLSKGFYLSLWFEFALRPESAELSRQMDHDRLFLETDGADVDIREIYRKVAGDMGMTDDGLRDITFNNYKTFIGFQNT